MLNWIRNVNNYEEALKISDEIDWIRALPFIIIHLSGILAFFVHPSPLAIIIAVVLYLARVFFIGAFYHRYFSHKAYQTNRIWQFIFALLSSTCAQRGVLWWAPHHRQHHMVSDSESDVHSPVQHGFLWSHIGWFLSKRHYHYNPERVRDLAKYPELVFLEKFDTLGPALLLFTLVLSGYLLETYTPQFHTGIVEMVVWGFSVSTIALFHTTVVINSLSHVFGKKRYDTPDNSRNNFLLAILTLGEGWHNNHHHYPNSARQGFFWWEIDITYYILKLMERLGMIWDLKGIPNAARNAKLIKNGDH